VLDDKKISTYQSTLEGQSRKYSLATRVDGFLIVRSHLWSTDTVLRRSFYWDIWENPPGTYSRFQAFFRQSYLFHLVSTGSPHTKAQCIISLKHHLTSHMPVFLFSFPPNLTLDLHALLHRHRPQTHLETSFRLCLIYILLESSLRTAMPNISLSFP